MMYNAILNYIFIMVELLKHRIILVYSPDNETYWYNFIGNEVFNQDNWLKRY